MNIDSSTSLYCLIGDPIDKSLSPEIHNMSFERNNINARYTAFSVKSKYLEDAVKGIKALGIKGFNITIPHKVNIIKYLDEMDREAEILGAVNTVKNIDGKLRGYNTDGRGFVELLVQNSVDLKGKKIIVIGAGGAARAIAMSTALSGAGEICVVNRTRDKAENLTSEIGSKIEGVRTSIGVKKEDIDTYDIIVNCTSVGMDPNTDDIPLDIRGISKDIVIADIVYKPLRTKFLEIARGQGNKTIEGLGMLINQAILSEEIWLERDVEKKYIIGEFNKRFK